MTSDQYQLLRDQYHDQVYAKNNVLDGEFAGMMVIYDRMYGKYMPQDKSALIGDIASGAGQFLKYCKNLGYVNYVGVELSKGQVEYARTVVGIDHVIFEDGLEYLGKMPGMFDLIVANDFIEHLTKARGVEFVSLVMRALRPGGRIILKTGNMAAFGGLVIWCNGIDHECGYTERSLDTLLAINGFEGREIIPYRERRRIFNMTQAAFHLVLRLMYRFLYAGNYPKYYGKIIGITGVKPG